MLTFLCGCNRPIDELATFATASKKATGSGVTTGSSPMPSAPARYAVRQVLQQELVKLRVVQAAEARAARGGATGPAAGADGNGENIIPPSAAAAYNDDALQAKSKPLVPAKGVKRDFFGRVIVNEERVDGTSGSAGGKARPGSRSGKLKGSNGGGAGGGAGGSGADAGGAGGKGERIWVSYHEGFSNAVRKPIGLRELMEGL